MRRPSGHPGQARPVLITAAPRSRYEESGDRRRQYLITMSLRVVCFLVAVVVSVPIVRIIAVVGACVLPYIAVVAANTVRSVAPDTRPAYYIPPPVNELTGAPEVLHDSEPV